jgi:hypothetical protein
MDSDKPNYEINSTTVCTDDVSITGKTTMTDKISGSLSDDLSSSNQSVAEGISVSTDNSNMSLLNDLSSSNQSISKGLSVSTDNSNMSLINDLSSSNQSVAEGISVSTDNSNMSIINDMIISGDSLLNNELSDNIIGSDKQLSENTLDQLANLHAPTKTWSLVDCYRNKYFLDEDNIEALSNELMDMNIMDPHHPMNIMAPYHPMMNRGPHHSMMNSRDPDNSMINIMAPHNSMINIMDPHNSLLDNNIANVRRGMIPTIYTEQPSRYNVTFNPFNYKYTEDGQIALATEFSIFGDRVKIDPNSIYLKFIEFVRTKEFGKAEKLYQSSNDSVKELIDSKLDDIPWRVSSEYLIKDDKICWVNTWIKIGWWDREEVEISPQINDGYWDFDDNNVREGIHTHYFRCTVWKGKDKNLIHRLLSGETRANVELQLIDGFLNPINVAFKCPTDHNNILDLGFIEIGTFDPIVEEDIDALRIFHHTNEGPNNTQIVYYKGSSLGITFVPQKYSSTLDENYDNNDTFDMPLINDDDTNETFDMSIINDDEDDYIDY